MNREPVKKDFRKRNAYNKFLKEAKEKINSKTKVNLLFSKIENATLEEIEDIMELIDEYFRK